MSVINTHYDDWDNCRDNHKCFICGDNLSYPFAFWCEGGNPLCICGSCRQQSKDGLIAVAAIMDLQDLKLSDRDVVLVRSRRQDLEAEAEKQRAKEQATKIVSIKKERRGDIEIGG